MAGGGATPGAMTEYPDYQMDIHSQWLDGRTALDATDGIDLASNLNTIMNTLINQIYTPYYGEEAFDPEDLLEENLVKLDDFFAQLENLDRDAEFTDMNTLAVQLGDTDFEVPDDVSYIKSMEVAMADAVAAATSALLDPIIADDVEQYRLQSEARLANNLTRFSAGMADINAVHSSAFVLGTALIESENAKDVNQYESKMRLGIFQQAIADGISTHLKVVLTRNAARDSFIVSAINEMNKLSLMILDLQKATLAIYDNYYSKAIIAGKEYQREQLEIDVNYAMWDLKVMMSGANVLGAIAGTGVPATQEMNPVQSAISGLAGGAAMGASVGTMFGNPAIGAGVGAGLGLLAGLLK